MNVTTSPKANQSAFRDACFTLSGVQAPGGVDIQIQSASPARLLGTKRIYATGTASINVAPYVRQLIAPQPKCGLSAGITVDTGRAVPCYISAPGFTSPSVCLTGGTEDPPSNAVMSASPRQVKLAPGEKDEVSVVVNSILEPALIFRYNDRQYTDSTSMAAVSHSGIATVVVDFDAAARSFAAATGADAGEMTEFTIRVRMLVTGGELYLDRRYTVDRTPRTGRRLAWVNRYGAIDYYTFPVIGETRCEGSRTRIETPAGYRTVATSSVKSETLLSEPCDSASADWLSELFSSPAVWKIEKNKPERVEISGGSVTASRLQPAVVSVTVSPATGTVSRKY